MTIAPDKPKRLPRGVIPVVLIALALALLTLGVREGEGGPIHNLRRAAMTVTVPMQQLGSFLAVPLKTLNEAGDNAVVASETLTELRTNNEELTALVGRLEEARLENERLKALLGLVDAYKLESATARILSHSSDSWNQIITIDKGSGDGISTGMTVMSPNGLLGQVETVGQFSATVRLITDPSSGVAVFLQASRAECILSGSSERLLYLSYLPIDSPVEPGDVVITSGAGGVYPKGIVIGEVVSATHGVADVYQTVVVKPVSRVESYEEVVVLTGRNAAVATPDLSSLALSSSAKSDSSSSSGAASGSGNAASGSGTTSGSGASRASESGN
ncbi:MAG: rod shape-determining protein MreC [Coriobacteriales bacterium]|jgi:rod shape-determining protein MreC|nr:rod shape-determining protein MreC [Coriobacteriales bacterium]